MIAWIILGIFLIIGLIIIKLGYAKSKIKVIAIFLIIVLVYASASSVLSKNDIKLNSVDGYGKAVSLYLGWMVDAGSGLWKVSGDVIKTIKDTAMGNTTRK